MPKNINKSLSSWLGLLLIVAVASGTFYFKKAGAQTQEQVDTDRDGLTDLLEREHGTDPLKIDTDGDGYTDYQEVRTGYDPLKPAPGDELSPNVDNHDGASDPGSASDAEDPVGSGEEVISTDSSEYLKRYYSDPITENTNLTDVFVDTVSFIKNQNDTEGVDITLDQVEDIIQEVVPEDQMVMDFPIPEAEEITVVNKTTKENLQAYFLALNTLFINNFIGSEDDKEEIFKNNNYSPFEKYAEDIFTIDGSGAVDMQLMFQRIYSDSKELEVPSEAEEAHRTFLVCMKAYDDVFEDVANMEDDPIRALVAYNKFRQVNEYLVDYYESYEKLRKDYELILE